MFLSGAMLCREVLRYFCQYVGEKLIEQMLPRYEEKSCICVFLPLKVSFCCFVRV